MKPTDEERPDEARIVENQAASREVNERAVARRDRFLRAEFGDVPVSFLCECGSGQCAERIDLWLEEYTGVREHHDRFLIVPGHETPLDRVLAEYERFTVVEKIATPDG
jgi:hypothetical protein